MRWQVFALTLPVPTASWRRVALAPTYRQRGEHRLCQHATRGVWRNQTISRTRLSPAMDGPRTDLRTVSQAPLYCPYD